MPGTLPATTSTGGQTGLPVEVRRSRRRRRTVSAYEDDGRVVVLLPASFTKAQEREWVDRMVARLAARRRRQPASDQELLARAVELGRRYLDGARPVSVRWVTNQRTRWGSCTPTDRTIRLSDRLADMPTWVVDYVLLHELAHLRVPDHSAKFWRLLEAYPRTERARGYLEGVAAAAGLDIGEDDESE
ncbi:M48 metallopeptidase family protein [Fodinicola feengrottensis]|uniref:M48 family metallopeptidase n=2 Tax=Fodinicola feengrottensis TaxID=435914 RepID=A0ABP4UM05_9ACTN|nr:M48 family metallopeptidase [Fodinicola feengrottensis]